MKIVIIAHYYPPINSSGAKRAESLSKYFTSFGHEVTVITTRKSKADGAFTEPVPAGVHLLELDWAGQARSSVDAGVNFEPMYSNKPSWRRRLKDRVMDVLGQIPDPRLPFAIAFLLPWFARRASYAIRAADVVIGTTPPWPMLLAALFCKLRFGKRCVLDYRDHFSECHEMPGGRFAKWLEKVIDQRLVNNADHVVCISDPMRSYYGTLAPKVETILNGYDHEIMNEARRSCCVVADGLVRIRYMGIVSPGRVPHNVIKAVVRLKDQHPDLFHRLRFEFFGSAACMQEVLANSYSDVVGVFHFFEPIRYFESLKQIVEADYLLFSETSSTKTLSAQGILTTKLFEYIGAGRPILGDISPGTLAGGLLLKSSKRHIVGESPELFFNVMSHQSFYERAADEVSPISESLSRKAQALRYTDLLEKVALLKV